jgi:hypothetical protein
MKEDRSSEEDLERESMVGPSSVWWKITVRYATRENVRNV